MRKVILCALLLCTTAASFAQTTASTPPAPLTREAYLRKSGGQTAGAILLMAAGAGLSFGALSYDLNHMFDATASNTTGLYIAALGCVGGSVALLSAAGRNRRLARRTPVTPSLQLEQAPVPATGGIKTQHYPSVSFSVRL